MTKAQILLWIYIVLLMAGGLTGFLKAGSKASLIASSIFAAVLALFALNVLPLAYAWTVLAVLAAFFGRKFIASKKFMPSGLMAILSLVFLALMFLL